MSSECQYLDTTMNLRGVREAKKLDPISMLTYMSYKLIVELHSAEYARFASSTIGNECHDSFHISPYAIGSIKS
jgi:hypothetical protein